MTLLMLCEPLFQYVCELNRKARNRAPLDEAQVESEIETLLEEIKAKASDAPGLSEQFDKVYFPLLYFIDNIICNSTSIPFAGEWNRLAYKKNKRRGDKDFFTDLENTGNETGAAADERLAVFYTCLGLGFLGWYSRDAKGLAAVREKMRAIEPRISRLMETNPKARVTPDAYRYTNTENLIRPPAEPVTRIVLVFAGLLVVLLGMIWFVYREQTKDFNKTLNHIIDPDSSSS